MCDTCGCSDENGGYKIIGAAEVGKNEMHIHPHDHNHEHDHSHSHPHEHTHSHEDEKRISVETDVLRRNNLTAQRNRGFFEAKDIIAINLVSSPGSGKTSILEKTLKSSVNKSVYVIEGDQQTTLDAQRIQSTGAPVVQVNTGNGCHLDAEMVYHAMKELNPSDHALLFIENVGNLVCPALFDLGESYRVVIISVTEGEDKPLKYPNMFATAQLCLVNKTDLLPYVDFNLESMKNHARKINPQLEFIPLSAKTGEGLTDWIGWLNSHDS